MIISWRRGFWNCRLRIEWAVWWSMHFWTAKVADFALVVIDWWVPTFVLWLMCRDLSNVWSLWWRNHFYVNVLDKGEREVNETKRNGCLLMEAQFIYVIWSPRWWLPNWHAPAPTANCIFGAVKLTLGTFPPPSPLPRSQQPETAFCDRTSRLFAPLSYIQTVIGTEC